MINLVALVVTLLVVGIASQHGAAQGQGRRMLALSARTPSEDERVDAALEGIGRALADGLGFEGFERSHRSLRLRLAGQLRGGVLASGSPSARACEVRMSASTLTCRLALATKLPSGIHLRRQGDDYAVDMGHVREPIPQGLVPALRRACDERVLRASLVDGALELEFAVDLPSLAARPEAAVALLRHVSARAVSLEARRFVV